MAFCLPIYLMAAFAVTAARFQLESESHDLNRHLIGIRSEDDVLVQQMGQPVDQRTILPKERTGLTATDESISAILLPLTLMQKAISRTAVTVNQVNELLSKFMTSTLRQMG